MSKGVSFRDKFLYLYRRGYTLTAIAKLHNVSHTLVAELLARSGLGDIQERCLEIIADEPRPPTIKRTYPHGTRRSLRRRAVVENPERVIEKTWCAQCERLVATVQMGSCASPWCKAREAA